MMGMGHYRGGGVGRIKGFVSQGVASASLGRPASRPFGIAPGKSGTLTDRWEWFWENVGPPPARYFDPPTTDLAVRGSRLGGSATASMRPRGTRRICSIYIGSRWSMEEGTGPSPRFIAGARNDRRMGVGMWGIG